MFSRPRVPCDTYDLTPFCLNAGGRSGIPSGALTASLLCTLLQLGVNEATIWRVKYVSRRTADASQSWPLQQEDDSWEWTTTTPATFDATGSLHHPQTPRPALGPPNIHSSPPPLAPPQPTQPLSQRILSAIGIHRLSDEEYVEVLKKERQGHLDRIRELEREVRVGVGEGEGTGMRIYDEERKSS